MKNSEVIDVLNNLIAKNYDAEEGYKEVAEMTDNPSLKAYLYSRSQQRYDFGHEIKAEIKRLGGEVDKGTTVLADMHRAWIKLKDVFSTNDEIALLAEAERGEENALEEYDEAIKQLTGFEHAFSVVSAQGAKIATALADVKIRQKMFAEA